MKFNFKHNGNPLQKKMRPGEIIAEAMIKSIAFFSFAIIILIFVFVFRETLPLFANHQTTSPKTEVLKSETYGDDSSTASQYPQAETKNETAEPSDQNPMKSLSGKEWQPVSSQPKYGLWPLVVGSFKVTMISIIIGAPIAILAALFTASFAGKKSREIIKPAIELLAGFPSVVIGFFALITLATLCQNIFGCQYRLNSFVGGLALSLAVIPIVYTVSEDALTAIPKYMTEASLALGATKWQTSLFVVLPAATPGIFAALLLGVGRAFGETMIVLMATGNAPLSSMNIFDPVRTMSATIGAEMAEVVFGDTHYGVLFLIGSILFIFTFVLNAIAEFWVRNRLMKRFRGAA
jgi:phosphate transport system permease protein